MNGNYRFTAQTIQIPPGFLGTQATLRIVKQLARADHDSPEIWRLARMLTRDVPSYDLLGEVDAIQRFVRDDIRYVRDPLHTEAVQLPRTTLRIESGDCDDKTALAGSLLQSIGYPVRYVLSKTDRRRPERFSHIYPETEVHGRWLPVETIIPGAPLGWRAASLGSLYVEG